MILSIEANNITPDILRGIANELEKTGLYQGHYPYPYKILLTPKEVFSDLYPDIDCDADTARDELDDVVIGLTGLGDLHGIAIAELQKKFPEENIEGYFHDIQEYLSLIVPHASDARKAVVDMNLAIDPEYSYAELPKYTVIT